MRIYLRPITLDDGKHIVKWRNDKNVLNHCLSKAIITEDSNREFYLANVATGKYIQFIVERIDEDYGVFVYPIATVYLKDIDYDNKKCELCIFTSSDVEWMSESQSIAIKMLVKKAFKEYGMHKLYSYVFYKFPEEIELIKNAGFSIEATLKEEALNEDGLYEDIIRLSAINQK